MKVLFRADASTGSGTGHVMRCLALAQALQDAGHATALAASELPTALGRRLEAEGVAVYALDVAVGSDGDADGTTRIAAAADADWLVLDGYRFPDAFLGAVAGPWRLMVIDDLGRAGLGASVLLNANLYASPRLYPQLAASCDALLGASYALLRREFRLATPPNSPDGPVRHVLVSLGGADPANATLAVVRGLVTAGVDADVRVLIGSAHPDPASVRAAAGTAGYAVVHDAVAMIEQLAWADLVIGAGGTSGLEFARCGVPAILVVLADNQLASSRALAEAGVARTIGAVDAGLDARLVEALHDLVPDRPARAEMRRRGPMLVDGSGAERVARVMAQPELSLRAATLADADLLLSWANDPAVRAASFRSAPIGEEAHVQWLRARLADPHTRIWIAEVRNGPVGVVRFEPSGDDAVISVTIAAEWRGRGIGQALIGLATRRLAFEDGVVKRVVAWTRGDNEASIRAFEAAGYRVDSPATRPAGVPPDARHLVFEPGTP